MSSEKYRAYFFGNSYLSAHQQGIQATHVLGELMCKYQDDSEQTNALKTWAEEDKTIVLLNGGNHLELHRVHKKLEEFANQFKLPLAHFYEDEESLNGALTAVGIIIPSSIYDTKLYGEDTTIFKESNISLTTRFPDNHKVLPDNDFDSYQFKKYLSSFNLVV